MQKKAYTYEIEGSMMSVARIGNQIGKDMKCLTGTKREVLIIKHFMQVPMDLCLSL